MRKDLRAQEIWVGSWGLSGWLMEFSSPLLIPAHPKCCILQLSEPSLKTLRCQDAHGEPGEQHAARQQVEEKTTLGSEHRAARTPCAAFPFLSKELPQLPLISSHCGSPRSCRIFSTCKRGLGPLTPLFPFALYRSIRSLAKWIMSNKSLRVSVFLSWTQVC